MTITEFLIARIAEDEELATEALPRESDVYGARGWYDPAHVLAECAAKRAVIGLHRAVKDDYDADYATCSMCTETGPEAQGWPCATIKSLAAVYADHPDYLQEWAPNTPA